MRELIARLIDWFRRDELERELTEELRLHRQLLERDAGVPAAEARHIASRRLGSMTRVREAARERWSIPSLDQLQQDVRYALRGLRRSPGFTATVIITLGLGIGANAAMFNVIDRLIFRPLAYLRDPGTVHRIYWQWQDHETVRTSMSGPYRRYLDLRDGTTSFSQYAGFSERDLAVGEGESSRERRVGAVSASFFEFFDAKPALGRFFGRDEDVTPRGADVAVLSHDFWQSEFGGRDVRGELLQVGNVRATIIGVAPKGFAGVNDAVPPAVYVPITTFAGSTGTTDAKTYFTTYKWGWMHVLVRRKPDVSLESATLDASAAWRRSWRVAGVDAPLNVPVERATPRVVVSSVRPGAGPDPTLESRTALWVTGVAAIVLLIACANVANLGLARALQRQRETAVRLALGVSRWRLTRQALTEGVVLALMGGATALLIARWAGAGISGSLVPTVAPSGVFGDSRTLGFTIALTSVVGIIIGFVPSLLRRREGLAGTLRGGVRGGMSQGARLRTTMLVIQGALSVVLLVGAALFVRSLNAVQAMRMGYDAERVLLVDRVLRGPWPGDAGLRAMRDILMTTAQSLPIVESATWASSAPFISTWNTALIVPGIDSVSRFGTFTYQAATPEYFRTMGTRITRGRAFTAEDRLGAPSVTVVSESMARVLWPGEDAIGKCFRVFSDTMPCFNVVGVAEDMVQQNITDDRRYHYYLPLDQFTRTSGNRMILRLRGDPVVEGEKIRKALQRAMPGASYVTVQPLRDVVQSAQRSWRLGATMFVAFGLLAIVVAAVGLYGVIAYNVTQRTHELGVRVALGARRHDIIRLVVGQSVQLALAGVAVGLTLAFALSRWIQPLLFRQSATDPRVYFAIATLMVVVALSAGAFPGLRAAKADPNAALRAE
jgi:putative ABC transport system permease protein